MFLGEFKLKDGCLIKDIESGIAYEIQAKDSKKIYGLNSVNHSTYSISIKSESDKHGLYLRKLENRLKV